MLSLYSLRSHHSTLTRLAGAARSHFELPASPALLASLAASALASAGLRSRFARACRLACLLRSPCRLLASLDPPFSAARSARRLFCCPPSLRSGRFSCLFGLRSPPRLLLLSLRSSARLLLAPLATSTAARFARRWLLRLLLTSLAVYLLDLLAHLTLGPCMDFFLDERYTC